MAGSEQQRFPHDNCVLFDMCYPCRSGKVLGWAAQRKSWTHDVFFGWNAAVLQQGTISVGDTVTVTQPRTA